MSQEIRDIIELLNEKYSNNTISKESDESQEDSPRYVKIGDYSGVLSD